jgi:flagellar hook assembly protein FlgD
MRNLLIVISLMFVFTVYAHAVKAYPNPWIPDSKTDRNRHGDYTGVKFDGLSNTGGTIYIYNATGELVRKVNWTAGNVDVKWDGKNDRSEYVASGVYIWVIKDGGTKSGKIVVVR